jgi:hypothetical protein
VHTELLFTIGEIAVAFAGFAGLVVALARRGDRSAAEAQLDVVHLKNVLAQSLFAVAFALLPAMLEAMGVGVGTAWRVSALLFAVLYGLYLGRIVPAGNAGFRNSGQRVPLLFRLNSVIGFLMVGALILCAAGIAPTATYLPVLGFCLYGSGTSFVRVFLSVARGAAAA